MKYLFVDNFRGFAKTLIRIKDVNFLVGENSTGKTSILSLINLLTTPPFWFSHQDFNNDEVELGNFNDIVSVGSTNKRSFRIGFVEFDKIASKKKKPFIFSVLLTFEGKDGVPNLKHFHLLDYSCEIEAKIGEKEIYYYTKKNSFTQNLTDDVLKIYESWINEERSDDEIFSKIDVPDNIIGKRKHVMQVLSLIEKQLSKDKKIERGDIPYPPFNEELTWIAPIRSKPKRTYDLYKIDFSPEGSHSPYLIRRIMKGDNTKNAFNDFVREFGKNSGLFKEIKIKELGNYADAPFELDIVLDQQALNINSVGYGVSQCLPIIVELFARPKDSWLSIQQPEVHLHPKAQAALGDLIYNFSISENKKFFVETHSDYTIDRFRLNLKKSKTNTIESQILFFYRTDKGNIINNIAIENAGAYSENQPTQFRDFFVKESLDLLDIN